jgi:[ribosomal protein S5]-alanine N-acetyltransferase
MFHIETERLVIRPWQPDDRPAFTAVMAHPEVTQYVHGGQPYTEAEVDEWFARQARQIAEHGMCMGALVEKATGRLAGLSGTQPLGTTGDLEIGWILAREAWGRGYATEAGAAAMRHVLETLNRPRVVAIIDPGNEPSKRVAARLGMTYEATYTGEQLGHRFPQIVVDLFSRERRSAFPTFEVAADAAPITLDGVKDALDDD